MRNIAQLSVQDRSDLFRNTADRMGLSDAIVEKDFWVCFTLDYLFHRSPWKEARMIVGIVHEYFKSIFHILLILVLAKFFKLIIQKSNIQQQSKMNVHDENSKF